MDEQERFWDEMAKGLGVLDMEVERRYLEILGEADGDGLETPAESSG